jgi:hypothetical protein
MRVIASAFLSYRNNQRGLVCLLEEDAKLVGDSILDTGDSEGSPFGNCVLHALNELIVDKDGPLR